MKTPFAWPTGKRCALSFSFDDSRPSQLDAGLPVFAKHGFKATFYVVPYRFEPRADEWRRAAASGHEIGNHTTTHPCSGDMEWSKHNALEDYTPERMCGELDNATKVIVEKLGVTPSTFAYPCGQRHIGRGATRQSYEPLVNARFFYARGDEILRSPPQVLARGSDRTSLEEMRQHLAEAQRVEGWLILIGHEVGPESHPDPLTTLTDALDTFCRELAEKHPDVWVAPVSHIAAHIAAQRK